MRTPRSVAAIIVLSLVSACATSLRRGAAPAIVDGHWLGTYYQYNLKAGYTMELTSAPTSNEEFGVTLGWPEPVSATSVPSETVGRGAYQGQIVTWSEDRLVRGKNIVLGGRYSASFLDADTLVGTYKNEGEEGGFFTLSRVRPEKLAVAKQKSVANEK